jgi:hypothetical protein
MSELNAIFTKASQGYGRDFRELLREWKSCVATFTAFHSNH